MSITRRSLDASGEHHTDDHRRPAGLYVAEFTPAGEADNGEKWDDHFSLEPIVAWEIVREERTYYRSAGRHPSDRFVCHQTIPVTLNGNMENSLDAWAVKTPDGAFDFIADAFLPTEARALAHARAAYDRDGGRKARAAAAAKFVAAANAAP